MYDFVLLCHLEVMWKGASFVISLVSSFFICEMRLLLPSPVFLRVLNREWPHVMHIVMSVALELKILITATETLWDIIKALIRYRSLKEGCKTDTPIAQHSVNQVCGNALGFIEWRVGVAHFNHHGPERLHSL